MALAYQAEKWGSELPDAERGYFLKKKKRGREEIPLCLPWSWLKKKFALINSIAFHNISLQTVK